MRRIVICSRHSILVAGFRAVIAERAGLEVVECPGLTECPNPVGLGDLPRTAGSESPVLLLIDVASIATAQSLAELKSRIPNANVILWVDWISSEFVRESLQGGVRGILRKDAPPVQYVECLRHVAAGEIWLENDLSQKLLSGKSVRLSPRERQLVHLLTEGLRNKEIAGRMNITEGTTKAYLSRLFEKTGASDRFELAMFALQNLETNPAAGPSRGPRIFLPLRSVFSQRA